MQRLQLKVLTFFSTCAHLAAAAAQVACRAVVSVEAEMGKADAVEELKDRPHEKRRRGRHGHADFSALQRCRTGNIQRPAVGLGFAGREKTV